MTEITSGGRCRLITTEHESQALSRMRRNCEQALKKCCDSNRIQMLLKLRTELSAAGGSFAVDSIVYRQCSMGNSHVERKFQRHPMSSGCHYPFASTAISRNVELSFSKADASSKEQTNVKRREKKTI